MTEMTKNEKTFNAIGQFALPGLTILAQIATSAKYPQIGLIIGLAAQPFWLYSSWKAYKQAGQSGLVVNTIIMTVIIAIGVINYWFL